MKDEAEMSAPMLGSVVEPPIANHYNGRMWVEADRYTELLAKYAALVSETRWIPVTERLPEDHIAVAVFVQGDHPADRSVTVAHMFQGHWRCPYFGEEFLEDVSIVMGRPTHWMPLPAPPTDGK